jgi:hypothetical protein
MAQAWSLIGLLATALIALIVATHRSISITGKHLSESMNSGLSGLRNEMIARFDQVDQRIDQVDNRLDKVEARLTKVEDKTIELDHDVRALNRSVLDNKPPPNE